MEEILTRSEVAEFFKIPIRTIDYLVSTQQIPFFRVGKRGVRFSRNRLMEWSREREGVEFRHRHKKHAKSA